MPLRAFPLDLPRWNSRPDGTVGAAEFDHFWRSVDHWGGRITDMIDERSAIIATQDTLTYNDSPLPRILADTVLPFDSAQTFFEVPPDVPSVTIGWNALPANSADAERSIMVQCNGQTGAVDYRNRYVINGTDTLLVATNQIRVGRINGANSSHPTWGKVTLQIGTDLETGLVGHGGFITAANINRFETVGLWRGGGTQALTEIRLFIASGTQFAAGSHFWMHTP